jgi:thiamine-phosphate pyrophosphorylase
MYQPDFPSVPFRLGLYPVVDSVAWIERLLAAGVRTLQLRIKDKRDSEVEDDVIAAIALGRKYHARLFINDYWRLAIKHQAYGVHLGQEDLETDLSAIRNAGLRLGVSTHDDMEIDIALAARPSYIALGTFFQRKPSRCLPPLRGWSSWRSIFSDWGLSNRGDWRHQP